MSPHDRGQNEAEYILAQMEHMYDQDTLITNMAGDKGVRVSPDGDEDIPVLKTSFTVENIGLVTQRVFADNRVLDRR